MKHQSSDIYLALWWWGQNKNEIHKYCNFLLLTKEQVEEEADKDELQGETDNLLLNKN